MNVHGSDIDIEQQTHEMNNPSIESHEKKKIITQRDSIFDLNVNSGEFNGVNANPADLSGEKSSESLINPAIT